MSYTCGTGSWSGPLPGDPSNNSILTATPAFGGIDVTWTPAIVNPHAVAHTYLYRSTNPDFLTAVRIAIVGGTHFYDKLETLLTYYYWIQVVSINGTLGEVIGPASAIPRLSIDATIVALTGRIDNGVLAQSLKSEIDRISLIDGDLFQEIQDRIAANELLGAAIQTAQTDASQAVSLLNEEITQRTTAYNVLLQTLNTMAGQVNDNKAAIETETTLRISNDEALAQQITNVQSAAGDNLAAVQTTLQTNINTVDGKVTDIGALYTAKVQVNGLIGGFGVYNDGTEVQAGFDVDTFWVGRTGPDKKKPFIIDSVTGETYIDKAVIPTLTADMIDTKGLSIRDMDGNVILAAGTALDWSLIGGSGKTTVESNASTALANAAEALATVEAAQIAADNANTVLADLASDSKLTPAEKKITKKEWDGIVAEKAGINSQATSFGISTENTNYNNAYNSLNSFITPLLSSLTTTSNIVGSTFRSTFSTFYTARQALLNKISEVAASKADWVAVTSKPTSLSGINSSEGSKLSGVQAGATVGATFGDYNGAGKNISGTITPGNISTFIANAAIGNAQFGGNLWSTNYNWNGNTGWSIERNGTIVCFNLIARGDIVASGLKANTAMVETLHIKGEAVVVPRIASTQSGLYFGSGMSATVQSVYIDAGGANVTVVGKVTVSVPQSMHYQTIQSILYLYAPNGQLLDSSSGVTTGAGGTLSLMVMGASPQAGTYYMTVSSAGSVTVSNRVLSATGAKR